MGVTQSYMVQYHNQNNCTLLTSRIRAPHQGCGRAGVRDVTMSLVALVLFSVVIECRFCVRVVPFGCVVRVSTVRITYNFRSYHGDRGRARF